MTTTDALYSPPAQRVPGDVLIEIGLAAAKRRRPVTLKLHKAWDPDKHPRGQPTNAGEFGPGGGTTDVTAPTHDPSAPSQSSILKPDMRVSATYPSSVSRTKEREEAGGQLAPTAVTTALYNEKGLKTVLARQTSIPGFKDIDPEDPGAMDEIKKRQTKYLVDAVDLSMKLSVEGTKAHAIWYPRANRIVGDWGRENGFDEPQSFAAAAILSPGADWANNLAWTHRIMDRVAHGDTKTTQAAIDGYEAAREAQYQGNLTLYERNVRLLPAKTKEWEAKAKAAEKAGKKPPKKPMVSKKPERSPKSGIKAGVPLSSLSDLDLAYYIRGESESMGKLYQEGGAPGMGDPSNIATSNTYQFMANAISVLRDGSMKNIDAKLGKQLKVRSFYNNISDPLDHKYQDVTTDTHHYGAANGLPIGMSDPLLSVMDTGGGNADTGVVGTYPIIADATRAATAIVNKKYAKQLGGDLTPNQVQSIVWEVHKNRFNSGIRKAGFVKAVGAIRQQVADGKLKPEEGEAAIEAARLELKATQAEKYRTPDDVERARKGNTLILSEPEMAARFDADAEGVARYG